MRYFIRVLLLVLVVLGTVNFGVDAQFLGQQSLSQSSYVIDQSGNLWSWGDNFYGQLGVGDRTNRTTPTLVPVPAGASKWVMVAGGANFAIAVADSDKLYAWGLNDKGQIGIGVGGGLYGVPMRIQNPLYVTSWKWVSAGADHCEALASDGRLFAWGDNTQGELGVGNTGFLITPQPVQFPTGVTSWADVAAGPGYTMMISQNGILFGCGMDSLGSFQPWEGPIQATLDTFRAYSPLPCLGASNRLESRIDQANDISGVPLNQDPLFYVAPDGGSIEQVAAVADGGWHTLVLSMDGRVAASGANGKGQLGIMDTAFTGGIVPFPAGVTQFVAIAAGLKHSLAIGNDGWLYAWGDDSDGELGIGAMPNQPSPVKVLKVCPPVSMSGSLSIPSDFYQPYSITLTVKNTSATTPIANANAFLLLGSPLGYGDSAMDAMLPTPIAPNGKANATWDGALRQQYFDSLYPTYFAYIQAPGSAPLLVYTNIYPVITGPWTICDPALVVDSITGQPIAGAEMVNPGPPQGVTYDSLPFDSNKMISDEKGMFTVCLKGPVTSFIPCPWPGYILLTEYPLNLLRENYRTQRSGLSEPIPEHLIYKLGPSPIQGIFTVPSLPFIGDSIVKVYYPDSLIGYALSRRLIFRTRDSGISWSAVYEADTDLHDVKFRDPAHGWAVGDGGEILSTTDTGESWVVAHVGTQNLRALAVIDADTAWAVGDSGMLVKRSGGAWAAQPSLGKYQLNAIHFLDPEHGVIGGNGIYYLYDSGGWSKCSIGTDVRSAYYAAPHLICFGGTNGAIVNFNDTNSACKPFAQEGTLTIDTLTFDSIYTTKSINSLYFLNATVGYAAGDSGASFVTYDGGTSWAPMEEFPGTATFVNFFSLAGHGVSENSVLNYTGVPDTFKSIVRGRLTFGNPPEPILGAEVDRIYVATINDTEYSAFIDDAFTNDQGNFVFTDIDGVFPYEYHVHFTDSGIAKTKVFYAVKGQPHKIITLNYNDYSAPDTTLDTVHALVDSQSTSVLSLDVRLAGSMANLTFNIPLAGTATILIQDVLGRIVNTVSDGIIAIGIHQAEVSLDALKNGTYYISLRSAEGSVTRRLVLLR